MQAEDLTPLFVESVLRKEGLLNDTEKVINIEHLGDSLTMEGVSQRVRVSYSNKVSLPDILFFKGREGAYWAGEQEVAFYKQIAPRMLLTLSPKCYGATYKKENGTYFVLLNDLSFSHYVLDPRVPPTSLSIQAMLLCLAQLHSYWWGNTILLDGIDNANAISKRFRRKIAFLNEIFSKFVDYLGDRLSPKRRKIFENVLDKFPSVFLNHLSNSENLTLVHRDAHAGNFFLPRNKEGNTLLFDWAQWGGHCGLHDVSYLIILSWYPDQRVRMEKDSVKYYHNSLCEYGVKNYDWKRCWDDYRLHSIEILLVLLETWGHHGLWAGHRWHQLEKALSAFEDLECAQFL